MTYRHLWLQLLIAFGGAAIVSMALAACLTTESSIGTSTLGASHRNGEYANRAGRASLATDRNVNPDMDRDMRGLRPADLRVYVNTTPTHRPR